MTPLEVLQELKKIKEPRYEKWSFPIRVGPNDAIAAELIEIALQRLGDDAKSYELLDVASSMFWWVMTNLSLDEPQMAGLASKDSSAVV